MSESPWNDPEVARQQRDLVDRQIAEKPWPRHFTALAEAVRDTQCPGDVLEIGCASGYGREILDRAGAAYRSYNGMDISAPALRIARERYPESRWSMDPGPGNDIVIDGSCVLHAEDWRAHLASLCKASRRWVILHRLPLAKVATTMGTTHGYDRDWPAWSFAFSDVVSEMFRLGFSVMGNMPADGDAVTTTFAKPRHYATYADRNYLPRLKALHASMLRHCVPFRLHVPAWDEDVAAWGAGESSTVTVEHVDVVLQDRPELAVSALPGPPRTTVEHYWTCGPQWIADVMRATGEPVTYVDADVMFHSSPEPVFAEIGGARAGIIPHGFAPVAAGLPGPTLESHRAFGLYNVGIVHFNDRAVAEGWAADCREWCYDRVEPSTQSYYPSRYGDQKYLDAWPMLYGARVVQYPGACLGPWAVHTRALDARDGVIHFGNRPLIAYHYSGLRELPDGHTVPTRLEYGLTARQEAMLYRPYYAALEAAKR